MNVIVEGGAIPALVRHLQAPPLSENDLGQKPFEHEVEKGSAFALGLLAVKVSFSFVLVYYCLGFRVCKTNSQELQLKVCYLLGM